MFKNKTVNGIHYSKFIASWKNVGGDTDRERKEFIEWLRILNVPEDDIVGIYNMAVNGNFELEEHARSFRMVKNINNH